MDLQQYLLALQARRKVFLLVFAAILVTAVTVSLFLPKRYDATATVLLDARDEQTATPGRDSPRGRAGWMYTQVDLIQSGKVAARVSRDLKLAQQPGMREAFESDTGGVGTIDDWIGANLLEKLKVDTGASNIVIIKYSSSDAQKAAAVANGFAKAYLDTSLEMRTEPSRQAADWFEEQLKGMRTQITDAQGKLIGFQKEKGIVGVDERMDVEYARLAELNTQLNVQKNATYDAQTRFKQAQEAAANGAAAVDALPEVLANGYINTVKATLQAAEGRLEEQSQVLGQNHPVYQRTAAEVQGLRERLSLEMKKVVASLGSAAEGAKRREAELKAAYDAQQERIMKAKDTRVELAVMTRDVDNAQRAYDAALGRYQTIKLESRARQTNLAMLTPAVEPTKPAAPRVGMILGLAIVVGGLLAAGVVYLLEMIDRRVRSRSDLESRLALPTLGRLSRWQPAGGRLLPATITGPRAARALPHPW